MFTSCISRDNDRFNYWFSTSYGRTAPLIIIGMIAFIPDAPSMVTGAATVMPAQLFTWAGMPEGMYIEKKQQQNFGFINNINFTKCNSYIFTKKLEVKW